MSNYPQRGNSNGRGRGRGSSSRGGRGRGARSAPGSNGPRLPSLLSDELGLARRAKTFRDDDRPSRGRGSYTSAPTRGVQSSRGGSSRHVTADEPHKKRKRPSPLPESDPGADEERPVDPPSKKKKTVIEKGSGFRTKVSSDAQTPLARMLAAQGGAASNSSSDEETEQPVNKRKPKKPTPATNDIVDISIMGSAFSGSGKKTQAEMDEDAEIVWLEYQLGKGKGRAKGDDEDLGDDGLDGAFLFWVRVCGACVLIGFRFVEFCG